MSPNRFLRRRSGIYGIRNLVNGKIYVGKTKDMYRRCGQYVYDFNTRRTGHLNDYLIKSIEKYGLGSFEFFPLEFCSNEQLSSRELFWIEHLNSTDRSVGYNLRLDSSSGMIVVAETSEKISRNLKTQWANGIRSSHSSKMKENWASNPYRVERQAEILRSLLTKYEYSIAKPSGETVVVNYAQLCDLGFKSVISQFHRKKTNRGQLKGHVIIRMSKVVSK